MNLPHTIGGNIESQELNDNFSYLDSEKVGKDAVVDIENFGIAGDGETDDTAGFQALEETHTNKVIDLRGKTYLVTEPPTGNRYINGRFKVGDEILSTTDDFVRQGNTNVFAGKDAGSKNKQFPDDLASEGGYRNVGVGENALKENERGWRNVAVGHNALKNNIDGYNNVAVGDAALEHNVGGVGDANPSSSDPGARNTALGSFALRYNTTGRGNTAIGRNAAHTNETGNYNTAVGTNAYSGTATEGGQRDRKSASFNTAVGYNALFNTDNSNNIAVGYEAVYSNKTGRHNVGIGNHTNKTAEGSNRNVSVGNSSLRVLRTGSDNTALGSEALRFLEEGSSNTALGDLALAYDVNGNPLTNVTHAVGVGKQSRVSGNNQLQLGTSGITTYAYGAVQDRSDARDKADIRETKLGLEFINKLKPVDFKWDYRDDYIEIKEDGTVVKHPKDGSKKRKRYHHGLIAQDVKKAMDELGIDFGGYQDHKVNGGADVLTIGYTELIAPLIKAVQELSQRVEELEKVKQDD